MIVGIGVDLVEVARFDRALARTPRLAGRLFTAAERARPGPSLAARFAAKEALAKAIGAPPGLRWADAEVLTDAATGRPSLRVRDSIATAASRLGVHRWHVSLAHDGGMAVAVVLAEGQGGG